MGSRTTSAQGPFWSSSDRVNARRAKNPHLNAPPTPSPSRPSSSPPQEAGGGSGSQGCTCLFPPKIVTVDSLDPSDDEAQPREIVSFIAEALRVRFFITSRAEPRIREAFTNREFQHINLDSFDPRDDILAFLKHFLPRDLPRADQLRTLVHKASLLFIYAVTVVSFLNDRHHVPSCRLGVAFAIEQASDPSMLAPLDKVYKAIFLASGFDDRTRDIVAAIILLFDPLSIAQLESLLKFQEGEGALRMQDLHSL